MMCCSHVLIGMLCKQRQYLERLRELNENRLLPNNRGRASQVRGVLQAVIIPAQPHNAAFGCRSMEVAPSTSSKDLFIRAHGIHM